MIVGAWETTAFLLLVAFVITAVAAQLLSIAAFLVRAHIVSRWRPESRPAITILRPVCGVDSHAEETLRSTFNVDYPRFEILFCVASSADTAIPLICGLIAAHPQVRARLLVGEDRIGDNPKLNNLVKGWQAASHEFIVMADSNLLLPTDYCDQLYACWNGNTGLVSAPSFGGRPANLGAEFECAFLNSYQSRWQFAAAALGSGFAQGKTMFWRRDLLDRAGGLIALAQEPAEDAAATKVARSAGREVRLLAKPFEQPLGRRSFLAVWQRQLRWARLRRDTFGILFFFEILSGGFPPLAAAAGLALCEAISWTTFATLVLAWYGSEVILICLMRWPLSSRTPLMLVARDLALPALWVAAWAGNTVTWHGKVIELRGPRRRMADSVRASLMRWSDGRNSGWQPSLQSYFRRNRP